MAATCPRGRRGVVSQVCIGPRYNSVGGHLKKGQSWSVVMNFKWQVNGS